MAAQERYTPRLAAVRGHRAGLAIWVPKEDGTKTPDTARWKQFQSERPDAETLRTLYAVPRDGVGVFTGAVSGNLEGFEFDDVDAYQVFKDTAEASYLDDLVERIEAGYLERSPGGGYHWLYRCSEIGGNTTLAARPYVDDDGKPKVQPLIQTRGEGGWLVLAPSGGRVHPTGNAYELLRGGVETIATITADERRELWRIAASLDEIPRDEYRPPAEPAPIDGTRPGDDFNRQARWDDILIPAGWTFVRRRGDVSYWRRPDKDRGISATTNYGGFDLLYVFTSSTPFRADAGYSKFRAYAVLEHGSDWAAAARELGKKGYGEQHDASNRPRLILSKNGVHKPDDDELTDLDINDFASYLPEHKYIFLPTRAMWPASSVNARIGGVQVGDKEMSAARWLDSYRPVEQMTWAPGEAELIPGRVVSNGGWVDKIGATIFNLYQPPIVAHGDADAAGEWIAHVERVYPDDAAHIIQWLAHRVQYPQHKINHALVLGGQQGIGKDTLLEPVKRAVGPWNFAEVSPIQLIGRFNGFVKSVILRVSEARDLGEVNRYSFYEHMKVYTAAPPDVLLCDEKHVHAYPVFNICGVVITTNHKMDGIYLPADDRRHFVAWSELTQSDFEPAYWNDLYRWYTAGGFGHVAAYLATLDISGFDPKAPPPKTAAFWDIVDANRAPEDAELADAIDALYNPDATTIDAITNKAMGNFAEWLRDRKNRRQIPHRLETVGYVPMRNPYAKDGLWKVLGKRQAIYAKRELSVTERLAAAREIAGG